MLSDAEIVARVCAGDVEAFGELAERYERGLLAAALAKLRDVHAAEDVVQATLLVAFRQLASLRDASRFRPWLTTILERQVVDTCRARRIPVVASADDASIEPVGESDTQIWLEHQSLLSLVDRLPERERILIEHRYFNGHRVAEIAAITGRPIGTVTKQLSRAVARLRSWFEGEDAR